VTNTSAISRNVEAVKSAYEHFSKGDAQALLAGFSDEMEFRVAEGHPKVIAYTKNHSLGLEVPYRYGSENRKYLPDFIVRVDDGRGDDDLLNLIVEIKGYRREDAKEKKSTMDTYWVPGVNHLQSYGRWAFAEFTDVYLIGTDFNAVVEKTFHEMIESVAAQPVA